MVSVMTFHCTVISPVISADPETVSFADGVDVPIPILAPELYILVDGTQFVPS